MALKPTLFVLAAVAQLSFSCEALDCGCNVPRIYSVGDCCNGVRKTVILKNDQPIGCGTCGCNPCGCGGTCGCNKKCGDTIVIKEPATCCGASVGPYYGGLSSYYANYGPYGCGSTCGYAAGYPYTYGINSGCGCGYGYGSTCGAAYGSTCGCGCGSTCGCGCGSTCGKTCPDTIVIREPTCRCSAC